MNARHPRLARLLIGLVAVAAGLVVASPAAAAPTIDPHATSVTAPAAQLTPTSTLPAADDPDDGHIPGLTVGLVSDLNPLATPQTTYGVLVRATSTMSVVEGARLEVAITNAALPDADALAAFLADPTAAATRVVNSVPVGEAGPLGGAALRVGQETSVSASVAPGGFGLDPATAGVYGVTITMLVDDKVAWQQVAPVTWQPRLMPPLAMSVVASVSGSPDRVTALLTAASDSRVTLMVDPSALSLAQRLSLSTREAFALPAGNLDITSAAHASASSLIERAVAAGRGNADLPWIAVAAGADQSTVNAASTQGAFGVLVDPRWAAQMPSVGSPVATVAGLTDVAPAPLILPDPVLSSALASSAPSDPTSTARLYAQTAFSALAGADSVILSPGDGWVIDGARPSRAIEAVLDAPFVTARTLAAQMSGADRPQVELPELADAESDISTDRIVAAANSLSALETLASATTSDSAMIANARSGVFTSLALGGRSDVMRRSDTMEEALDTAKQVAGAVTVTSGSDVLLVSRSGDLPITVHNGLDVPVSLRVSMTSRSPILVSRSQPTVLIDAQTDATVTVPVEAVSSGDANVSVALRTDAGSTIAVAETLRVRVRAAWGSAATGVVTAGLVVLLIAGIVRTIRRGRRETRVVPTATTPVAGASDAEA